MFLSAKRMSLIEQINLYMPAKKQGANIVLHRLRYRMKAFIITLHNHHESTVGARRCIQTMQEHNCNLEPLIYPAVTPENLSNTIERFFGADKLFQPRYTYPTEGEKYDMRSGMKLTAYKGANIKRRIACFMSHYSLWVECVKSDEPIMILEHDAVFTRKFEWNKFKRVIKEDSIVIALNDPRGATRKAKEFNYMVQRNYEKNAKKDAPDFICTVPWIDDKMVPQGLPGNSAYIITPGAARKLIDLTSEHGIWPNDAIMCQQLMPTKLKIAYPYYTKVKSTGPSTTSEMK